METENIFRVRKNFEIENISIKNLMAVESFDSEKIFKSRKWYKKLEECKNFELEKIKKNFLKLLPSFTWNFNTFYPKFE